MKAMNKYFEIIDKSVFMNEESYSNFLALFEVQFGKIDHVIQRKPQFQKEKLILEIIMEKLPAVNEIIQPKL